MANIYIAQKLHNQKVEARKQFIKDVIDGLAGVIFLSVLTIVFSIIFLGM